VQDRKETTAPAEVGPVLRPEERKSLSHRAPAPGKDAPGYAHQLVRRGIESPPLIAQAAEPIARAVQTSGISDDEEFDALFKQARQESWDEQHGRGSTAALRWGFALSRRGVRSGQEPTTQEKAVFATSGSRQDNPANTSWF